jgi:signal transduction histidine kinase
VVIGSVTLYFRRTETVMNRMARDRDRISKTGRELLELNQEIEEIVAERTRTELALRLAHEIRNPAVIIGGLIRRITKKTPDNNPEKEHLQKVLEQAEKLESLIAKIHVVGPDHISKFSCQELNALVDESVSAIQQEAEEKGIVIIWDRTSAALSFQGNKHLIKSAVFHVLRNALEICSPGDTVRISTELGDKRVTVRINDNGPGMAEEILEHVFEPFFSTEKGKTGIGLSYVRQIVEEHNGTVEVISKEGVGTSVIINLPPLLGELSRECRMNEKKGPE